MNNVTFSPLIIIILIIPIYGQKNLEACITTYFGQYKVVSKDEVHTSSKDFMMFLNLKY
jgi:hypothetical protein